VAPGFYRAMAACVFVASCRLHRLGHLRRFLHARPAAARCAARCHAAARWSAPRHSTHQKSLEKDYSLDTLKTTPSLQSSGVRSKCPPSTLFGRNRPSSPSKCGPLISARSFCRFTNISLDSGYFRTQTAAVPVSQNRQAQGLRAPVPQRRKVHSRGSPCSL